MADPGSYDAQRAEFRSKRERATTVLERLGFGIYPSPSSFYLWVRIPEGYADAMELNARLLERAGVAGVPGSAFADDPAWNRWMRLCIAREDAMLDGALERIARALA
jgi:aspartate/methionine/tyrosine aminotransferase